MTPAIYNPLISGHLGKPIFSCITLLKNPSWALKKKGCSQDLKSRWVRGLSKKWCTINLVFCSFDLKHIACSLKWTLKSHRGGEVGEKKDHWGPAGQTAASAHRRGWRLEEHNKFLLATLNRCVPVTRRTPGRRESRVRQHTCHVSRTFEFSSVQLIRAAEMRWPAESKQRKRKVNLLSQIYLSFSAAATLRRDWCPLCWPVVTTSLTKCKACFN